MWAFSLVKNVCSNCLLLCVFRVIYYTTKGKGQEEKDMKELKFNDLAVVPFVEEIANLGIKRKIITESQIKKTIKSL